MAVLVEFAFEALVHLADITETRFEQRRAGVDGALTAAADENHRRSPDTAMGSRPAEHHLAIVTSTSGAPATHSS